MGKDYAKMLYLYCVIIRTSACEKKIHEINDKCQNMLVDC